jgi:hypothetical protein
MEGQSLQLVPRWRPENRDFWVLVPLEGQGITPVMTQVLIGLNPAEEGQVFDFVFNR